MTARMVVFKFPIWEKGKVPWSMDPFPTEQKEFHVYLIYSDKMGIETIN